MSLILGSIEDEDDEDEYRPSTDQVDESIKKILDEILYLTKGNAVSFVATLCVIIEETDNPLRIAQAVYEAICIKHSKEQSEKGSH